jgi:hypothetical protein
MTATKETPAAGARSWLNEALEAANDRRRISVRAPWSDSAAPDTAAQAAKPPGQSALPDPENWGDQMRGLAFGGHTLSTDKRSTS